MSLKTYLSGIAKETLFWDLDEQIPSQLKNSYNFSTTHNSKIHVSDSYDSLAQSKAQIKILLENPTYHPHQPLDNLYIASSLSEVLSILTFNTQYRLTEI